MTTYLFDNFLGLSLPMSELQEVPPIADGPALGSFNAFLPGNTLLIEGLYGGLSSPLFPVGAADSEGNPQSAIHVHQAEAGQNGGIIRNLTVSEFDDTTGIFHGAFTLTDAETEAAAADEFYINLHTDNNQSGELRGQVLLDDLEATVGLGLPMSEAFEVPPVADTPAEGIVNAILTGNNLLIQGTFSDLSSDLFPVGDEDSAGNPQSAIHLHQGLANSNGGIIRNFDVIDNGDGSGGFFGDFTLSPDEIVAAESGNLYVNLHTENNQSGELRTQVLLNEIDPTGNDLATFLPISTVQEVDPVGPSDGSGTFYAVLSGNTLNISGDFSVVSSDLLNVGPSEDSEGNPQSSVHLHLGGLGENGDILRNLTVVETDGVGAGFFSGSFTLDETEVAAVESGGVYINLHTVNNPSGELRGQVILEDLDTVIPLDDVVFNGDNRDNNIDAGFANDIVRGFAGDDRLNGLAGDDRVIGGDGNDNLIGARGNDTLLGQDGNDVLEGRPGFDILLGGDGNDILNGGQGRDRLNGGAGDDELIGGASIDRFIFNTNEEFDSQDIGIDQINDFNSGQDRILLDLRTFTALDSSPGIGLSTDDFAIFSSEVDAATAEAKIVYNSASGALYYNANGTEDGFGSGAQFATLDGSPELVANDFQVR
ncbi:MULTISPECIES: CHRD domain-containing protein [unclassified Okeania]|uniref:CHRD domain-containing protein n=1 Tax=unclassified Okeania TaxID=2634635 RepID=UPI0013BBC5E4|nr:MULTISPECIES: CHRD domain-containing protein [unclassified Okeania]NES77620.1 CHRD domain-containing protein [Okeania sp. SIO1H4]NET21248.1 CHRD domain-containing protein [Okeania sp. SIO1H5]NET92675.1 CHRD domain-containing protein [Okeania sp. SIO1H2]